MVWTFEDKGLSRVLLRFAWGPRRVTSRKRYGTLQKAYPSQVSAAPSLWLRWWKEGITNWLFWRVQIVLPPSKANARITEALKATNQIEPKEKVDQTKIDLLTSEREKHRSSKNFIEADRIRDELLELGVTVKDGRV